MWEENIRGTDATWLRGHAAGVEPRPRWLTYGHRSACCGRRAWQADCQSLVRFVSDEALACEPGEDPIRDWIRPLCLPWEPLLHSFARRGVSLAWQGGGLRSVHARKGKYSERGVHLETLQEWQLSWRMTDVVHFQALNGIGQKMQFF